MFTFIVLYYCVRIAYTHRRNIFSALACATVAEEPLKMLGSQQDLGNVPYLFGSRDLWASKQTLVSTRYLAQRL